MTSSWSLFIQLAIWYIGFNLCSSFVNIPWCTCWCSAGCSQLYTHKYTRNWIIPRQRSQLKQKRHNTHERARTHTQTQTRHRTDSDHQFTPVIFVLRVISVGDLLNYDTGQLKCDGTRAETRFRLSAKRTSPFKSAGGRQFSRLLASRGVPISGSNAGYTMFRGSVKSTGYPLHSPVSPSLPLPCVTVCHHVSTGLY